jgi:hypothetical protein
MAVTLNFLTSPEVNVTLTVFPISTAGRALGACSVGNWVSRVVVHDVARKQKLTSRTRAHCHLFGFIGESFPSSVSGFGNDTAPWLLVHREPAQPIT